MDTHQPFPKPADLNSQSFSPHEIATASMEAIHKIDFLERSFLYVADRPFFLYGHTVDEVKKMGFDFFKKVVHEEDYIWLKKLQGAVQQHDHPDEIRYFAFSLRIKNKETGRYIMADHKLIPRFIDGQLRYAICLLSCSIFEESGNLRAYYFTETDFDEYSWKARKWCKKKMKPLNDREKSVLVLAKQGKDNEQIADKLCVSYQTVRNIETSMYRKLHVKTLFQAITVATFQHLIFVPERCDGKQKKKKSTTKKQRRPLTPEKLERIQECLNKGQSIRSIAKQENVGEWSIRYAIEVTKKLKKEP